MYLPEVQIGLSIEQQLEDRMLHDQIDQMSEAQIKELLLMTAKMLIQKDNIIKQLVRR